MATQLMNLPVNIPWKLVAASPDMMALRPTEDVDSGDVSPNEWRSSLAIYAYEPKPEDLDEALVAQRLTFLKVTCSITGYQPSGDEILAAMASYSDGFTFDLEREIGSYFACYGVLLNVSVFPGPASSAVDHHDLPPLKDYPHIIDFEPKKRDLYQAATENGEILTSSKSTLKTDKSFTSVHDSQTGLNMGAEVPVKGVTGKAGLTQNWGETDQDNRTTTIDSSRERRELQGSTTNLTQMYNLLTGYHSGTNRAVFLLLPRPHTLQPTLRRTFVQDLREIEGQQDFFLVVSRPSAQQALCIQANLETGHFVDLLTAHQGAEIAQKPYETDSVKIPHYAEQYIWPWQGGKPIDETYTVFGESSGWEFDPDEGDEGHISVHQEILINTESFLTADTETVEHYNYKVEEPNKLVISGKFTDGTHGIRNAPISGTHVFNREFEVFKRRQITETEQLVDDQERLLIAQRSLSVCIKHDGDCLKVVEDPRLIDFGLVDDITIPTGTRTAIQQIQSKMTGSASGLTRRPAGIGSFIDTDYFKDRIRKILPEDILKRPVAQVSDLPERVVEKLGRETPVTDLLDMDLPSFARKAGVNMEEAARVRRRMLGLPPAKVAKPTVADEQVHKPGKDAK